MRYSCLILLCMFLGVLSLPAQEEHSHGNIVVSDSSHTIIDTIANEARQGFITKVKNVISKERTFIIAPEFGRKPETGFLTGLYYLQLFKLTRELDSASRTSNVEAYFDYTERRQIIAQVRNNLLFKRERFILRGENVYTKFPSLFWGIGQHTTPEMQEAISFEMASITQRLVTKIGSRYFAGLQYHFMKVSNVQHTAGALFDQQSVPGATGSLTSGAGLVFLFDSRDNILNAYKGFYFDASILMNPKVLGGEYEFTNVTIDARKFIPLSRKNVRILALQALVNYNSGNVPFRQMAAMGGDQIMRGYYTGRFRDKILTAAQAEFRFLAWNRIGFTTFVAVAEVGPTFSAFNFNEVHYTYGGCVRFMINKKERLNIGIDTGFGRHTKGLYFNSGEAF